jgi:hypothetical protein
LAFKKESLRIQRSRHPGGHLTIEYSAGVRYPPDVPAALTVARADRPRMAGAHPAGDRRELMVHLVEMPGDGSVSPSAPAEA